MSHTLDDISFTDVYDGGRWELAEGVVLTTTYRPGLNEFDWSVTKHGVVVDYGLECNRPSYPKTVAYVAVYGCYKDGTVPAWWLAWCTRFASVEGHSYGA